MSRLIIAIFYAIILFGARLVVIHQNKMNGFAPILIRIPLMDCMFVHSEEVHAVHGPHLIFIKSMMMELYISKDSIRVKHVLTILELSVELQASRSRISQGLIYSMLSGSKIS